MKRETRSESRIWLDRLRTQLICIPTQPQPRPSNRQRSESILVNQLPYSNDYHRHHYVREYHYNNDYHYDYLHYDYLHYDYLHYDYHYYYHDDH